MIGGIPPAGIRGVGQPLGLGSAARPGVFNQKPLKGLAQELAAVATGDSFRFQESKKKDKNKYQEILTNALMGDAREGDSSYHLSPSALFRKVQKYCGTVDENSRLFKDRHLNKHMELARKLHSLFNEETDGDFLEFMRNHPETMHRFSDEGGLDQADEMFVLGYMANNEERARDTNGFISRNIDHLIKSYEPNITALEAEISVFEMSFFKKEKKKAKKWRHEYSWVVSLNEDELKQPLFILYRFSRNREMARARHHVKLNETVFEELTDLARGTVVQLESELSRRNKLYLQLVRSALFALQHMRTFNRLLNQLVIILTETKFYLHPRKKKEGRLIRRLRRNLLRKKRKNEQGNSDDSSQNQDDDDEQKTTDNIEDPLRTPYLMGLLVSEMLKVDLSIPMFLVCINSYMQDALKTKIVDGMMEKDMIRRRLIFMAHIKKIIESIPVHVFGLGEEGETKMISIHDILQKAYDFCVQAYVDAGGDVEEDDEDAFTRLFAKTKLHHIAIDHTA